MKYELSLIENNDSRFLCLKIDNFEDLWSALLRYCDIDINTICLEEFIGYEFPEASGSYFIIADIVRDNLITDITHSKEGKIEMSVDDLYNLIYRDITNYIGRIVL